MNLHSRGCRRKSGTFRETVTANRGHFQKLSPQIGDISRSCHRKSGTFPEAVTANQRHFPLIHMTLHLFLIRCHTISVLKRQKIAVYIIIIMMPTLIHKIHPKGILAISCFQLSENIDLIQLYFNLF